MLGAITGDVIGSRFEFDCGGKTKDFTLFTPDCGFTDDTVMTVAVADALLSCPRDAEKETLEKALTDRMRYWARLYPYAGYGARFHTWLCSADTKPYGSYGNGSAMRVSAAGRLYPTLERTLEVARITAGVTHNHPEGIKGAECTAAVMFLARTGHSKEEIRAYVTEHYDYDLSESLDELRNRHAHVETCMDSLPKALVSFFEGNDFEDVIRNAVSLGGDTDTLGAIAGAMAEAMYGVTPFCRAALQDYLPRDFLAVVKRFEEAVKER